MREKPGARGRPEPFTVLIKTVQQALRMELDKTLRDAGLTLPQLSVLATLSRMPGASNAELARAAFVSPQSMSELLATLERGRLIERAPDPQNARVLRTTLTPEGLKALGRGGAEAARVEARLTSALTAEEQRQLRALLERCAAALGGAEPEEDPPPLPPKERRGARSRAR